MTPQTNPSLRKFATINLSLIFFGVLLGGYFYIFTEYELIGFLVLIAGLSASAIHLGREFHFGLKEANLV